MLRSHPIFGATSFVLAFAASLLCPGGGKPMSVITVANTADALAALPTMHSGDTLELASGTYAGLAINGLAAPGINITSLDPTHPAVLLNPTIKNSTGINVYVLDVVGNGGNGSAGLTITGGGNINLSDIDFSSPVLAATAAANGVYPQASGLSVTGSANVNLSLSKLHDLYRGAIFSGSSGSIVNTDFFAIRSDGIDGYASGPMNISWNSFTDFYPEAILNSAGQWTGGDHPDGIQFWTSGASQATHDLTIDHNIMRRGAGSATYQGVFITDQNASPSKVPYVNISVTNNTFIMPGATGNFIDLDDVVNPTQTGNALYATKGGWFRNSRLSGVQTMSPNPPYAVAPLDGGAALWAAWMTARAALVSPPATVTQTPPVVASLAPSARLRGQIASVVLKGSILR